MGVPLMAAAGAIAAPFTGGASLIPLLTAGAGLAGAGISAYGQYQAGEASANDASFRAQVAANNAITAKRNADLEIGSGEITAANKGLQTRAAVGTQKASQGASGVEVGSGSSADVREGTRQMGLLDAITIRSNSARRAYGYQVAANSQDAQSTLDAAQAKQARAAAPLAAAGTLLSGASTVGSNFAKWQNVAPAGGGDAGMPLDILNPA